MASAYPIATEALVESVREMAVQDRAWPSQRKICRELKVSAPRASAALTALREQGFDPTAQGPAPVLTVVTDAPQTQAEPGQERTETHKVTAPKGAPEPVVQAVQERPQIAPKALVTPVAGAPTRTRRDWITDIGILVVGLAAAVITFTTLRALAEACGITGDVLGLPLPWLLPVCIDAAGIVATRVWLRGRGSDEAVRFARLLACTCIGLSIVANAGQHLLASQHLVPEWWVVVLVTSVPPAALGAVVHLGALLGRSRKSIAEEAS